MLYKAAGFLLASLIHPISASLQGYQYTSPVLEQNPLQYQAPNASMPRTPVYFFSHGGPTIIEQTEHPAYKWLQNIGREITQEVKPKAVIVVSAHWQAGPSTVEVNVGEYEPLIYEY